MKTLHTIFLLLISLSMNAQSTYIPMPDGYGTFGAAFEPKNSYPFYESNGYIYCYTQNSTNGYYVGKIAKVNVATNEVTILSGEISGADKPTFIKTNNGMIYFKSSSYNILYQINPATNSVINFNTTYLGGGQVLADYLFINDKMYYSSNGQASMYDFTLNTRTALKYYDTSNVLHYLDIRGIADGIFLTGFYWNEASGIKVFKINDNGSTAGLVYDSKNAAGGNRIFQDYSYIIKANNNLLTQTTKFQNGVDIYKIISINKSTNIVNPDFFTYENNTGTAQITPYVLNNILYITDGDKVYTSDGSSTPVLSNLPAFLNNRYVSYNSNLPLNSSSPNAVLTANNKVIGQRNYVAPSNGNPATSELWVSDGTLSGTHFFKNITNPYITAVFANNNFYFQQRNTDNNDAYLNVTDGTPQGTYAVYHFGFPITSNLYSSGQFMYYSGNTNTTNPGLYKLDLSALSQLSVKDTENQTKISIYPNPVKSTLYFSEELSDLKITDMSGKQVSSTKEKTKNISVDKLTKGNYLITGKNSKGEIISKKIIKQ